MGPGPSSPEDRRAAFAAGPGKVPSKVVAAFVGGLAVLALGGVLLDRAFPGPVGASAATTATTILTGFPPTSAAVTTVAPSSPVPLPGRALRSSTAALMGLKALKPVPASPFSLVDQHGRPAALAGFRGKVVVLSFFDGTCDDICPVMERELAQTEADLGPLMSRVEMVTVNTDPLDVSASGSAKAAAGAAAAGLGNWVILTGPVGRLNPVWRSYGISIEVQRKTGRVSHNDLLYLVDASGRLRLLATPFADQSRGGGFSLPRAVELQWAAGISGQVRSLLGATK